MIFSEVSGYHNRLHATNSAKIVGEALALHAGELGSIACLDRPQSLKQVVTAPLPNARH